MSQDEISAAQSAPQAGGGKLSDDMRLLQAEELAQTRGESLQEMQDIAKAVHAASIDGLVIFQAEKGADGRAENFIYREINPAACRMLGMQRADMVGRRLSDVFPGIEKTDIFAVFLRAYESGEPQELETSYILNGAEEWFRVTAVRYGPGGIANSFMIITDRKRKELQLKRSNEALRRFAGIVSHDLQTPLRHISLFADMVEQAVRYGRDPSEFLGHIRGNAARMQILIRSMLDYSILAYSRIRSDRIVLEEVLDEARCLLRPRLDDEGVEFAITPLPDAYGDKELLTRVFQNLFANSLRHAGAEKLKISVSGEMKNAIVTIRVADNGVGIPEHYAERIFEIGQRVASTRPTLDEGAGMGLAICKSVIESHGGNIWLDTAAHTGTVFCFTLPARPPLGE